MSSLWAIAGKTHGRDAGVRWWMAPAWVVASVLNASLANAMPCGVDDCQTTTNGSTQGCWDFIDPVCPAESLTCACGFPNLQAIHAVLTYNATTGVPRVLMFGATRPFANCSGFKGWGAALWNPVTHAGTWHFTNLGDFGGTPGAHEDLFCGGHTVLDDGRVLFVGGTFYDVGTGCDPEGNCCPNHSDNDGHNGAWVFHSSNPGPGWQRVLA
jgi:hypothetical protein